MKITDRRLTGRRFIQNDIYFERCFFHGDNYFTAGITCSFKYCSFEPESLFRPKTASITGHFTNCHFHGLPYGLYCSLSSSFVNCTGIYIFQEPERGYWLLMGEDRISAGCRIDLTIDEALIHWHQSFRLDKSSSVSEWYIERISEVFGLTDIKYYPTPKYPTAVTYSKLEGGTR